MQAKYRTSKFWIIGGGKFGLQAAIILSRQHPDTEITVIEKDSNTCRQLKKQAFDTVCLEGIRFLEQNLITTDTPDWIVPALDIPAHLKKVLPNPFAGDSGQLYISNADFICPENCSEPNEFCTVTGKPRPRILHQFLAEVRHKHFQSLALCSHQLAAGIGGYRPKALFDALGKIKASHNPVLLSTACRCHGVLNAFTISEKTNTYGK
jgi:hypothetical protein